MTLGSGRYWFAPLERDDAMSGIRVTLPRGTKVDGGKVKPPAPRMSVSQKIKQSKSKKVRVTRRTP